MLHSPPMAVHYLSSLFSNHHSLYIHNLTPKPRSKPKPKPKPKPNPNPFLFFSSLSSSSPSRTNNDFNPTALSRRLLFDLSINVSVILLNPFSSSLSIATDEVLSLQRYTDWKEGFTLLRPSSWIQVDKAGATVLFEETSKRSNNVGIVVIPVRITSLEEFGSPQFVADKLIEAERRKESTKQAEVVSVSERSGKGGLPVYEFEYKIDSTRGGMKRVFAAAFVASKKLYLLNISHSDGSEVPVDMDRRMILEQVLHSFDIAPLT